MTIGSVVFTVGAALMGGSGFVRPWAFEILVLGEPLLSDEHFEHYVAAFTRTGFRGGINWYRNIDSNAAAHPNVGVAPLDIPCLMLMAERDPALRPEFAADMPERCSNLEMHLVEKCGHWMQQEHPDVLNSYLMDWLGRHHD